jgi:biopolymer transport protein ExbD
MLRRPSSRRSGANGEQIELNLVPILDAMVTLISFLLFSASFLAIAVIDTPAPLLADPREVMEKLKKPPLNLTLRVQEAQLFLEGGFGNLVNRRIPNTAEGKPDTVALHTALLEVKSRFPDEKKLILMPDAGVNYETMVMIMDSARKFEKTDPSMFKKNPTTGVDEPETYLFPEIIFGNILS